MDEKPSSVKGAAAGTAAKKCPQAELFFRLEGIFLMGNYWFAAGINYPLDLSIKL